MSLIRLVAAFHKVEFVRLVSQVSYHVAAPSAIYQFLILNTDFTLVINRCLK